MAANCGIASPSSVLLRQKILQKCREDLYRFLDEEKGQVAIYDAVNPTAAGRRSLAKEFAKHDILVSKFGYASNHSNTNSWLSRQYSLNRCVMTQRSSKRMFARLRSHTRMYVVSTFSHYRGKANETQYAGWNAEDAVKAYLERVNAKIPHFETMDEPELNYIKVSGSVRYAV